MKLPTLAALFALSFAIACLVDRPSEELQCSQPADCAGFNDNRTCVGGYCIVSNCPDDCTSCNEGARTCQVDCTSTDQCGGTITCPSGWRCTVSCVGAGACNDIQCDDGSSCAITCTADNACGDIDCNNACQCDLECLGAACGSKSCPTVGGAGNQVHCTTDGNTGTECDSARDSRCASC